MGYATIFKDHVILKTHLLQLPTIVNQSLNRVLACVPTAIFSFCSLWQPYKMMMSSSEYANISLHSRV